MNTGFIAYLYARHWAGLVKHSLYQEAKYEYLDSMRYRDRKCYFCKKKVKSKDRSIDHIIPQSIIKKYDLYSLIWSPSNMRLAHKLCNTRRGADLTLLPENIKVLLRKLGEDI